MILFFPIVSGCAQSGNYQQSQPANIISCINKCKSKKSFCTSMCGFCGLDRSGFIYCYNGCISRCNKDMDRCINICKIEFQNN